MQELEKGRYAKTDLYVAHVYIMASRAVLLATNKRVMQVVRNDILGHLKVIIIISGYIILFPLFAFYYRWYFNRFYVRTA